MNDSRENKSPARPENRARARSAFFEKGAALPTRALIALLAGLRLRLLVRRLGGKGRFGALIGILFGLALAAALAIATTLGLQFLIARGGVVWTRFGLALSTFLTALFWVLWPVIALQVDEAQELDRYLHWPIKVSRLYLTQLTLSTLEPAALIFYPLLFGIVVALSSLAQNVALFWVAALLLLPSYVWMLLGSGRLLQSLLLHVLVSRRSGEAIASALLAFIALSMLLPAVDASWLFDRLAAFGQQANLGKIVHSTHAMELLPPGWLARGLWAAIGGDLASAAGYALAMGGVAMLASYLGWLAVDRFHRGGRQKRLRPSEHPSAIDAIDPPQNGDDSENRGDSSHRKNRNAARRRGAEKSAPACALLIAACELRQLWRTPKARLLFAVPFFLLVLLKIVGAPQLLSYARGSIWSGDLYAMLLLYALAVMGAQFLVNGYAYYGDAVALLFASPTPLGAWMIGRNLAFVVYAALQAIGLAALLVWALDADPRTLFLPLAGFGFAAALLFSAGNFLSATAPRRFHTALGRRDRPPAQSAFAVGILLTIAVGATAAVERLTERLFWSPLMSLPLLWAAGFLVYLASLSAAIRTTRKQRERLLAEIRD
jgi:ABC-2 type transport system permease protein